jgi:hypothetical protein
VDMGGNQTVAGSMTAGSNIRAGGNIYTDANYGYGLVGYYSPIRYQ